VFADQPVQHLHALGVQGFERLIQNPQRGLFLQGQSRQRHTPTLSLREGFHNLMATLMNRKLAHCLQGSHFIDGMIV
jgi:hypothetical protein